MDDTDSIPDAYEAPVSPAAPQSSKHGFLFRNRFTIYAFLIAAFIGWRIYRYYSWEKKRPSVFILYEKYLREHPQRPSSGDGRE